MAKEFFYPSQTADILVLRPVDMGWGITFTQILLVRRSPDAKCFPDCWALPGGFMDEADRDVYAAARRELKEETGLDAEKMNLIGVFTDAGRDPRGRVHSCAFSTCVPAGTEANGADDVVEARWFWILPPPSRTAVAKESDLWADGSQYGYVLRDAAETAMRGRVAIGEFAGLFAGELRNCGGMRPIAEDFHNVAGKLYLAFDHANIIASLVESDLPGWKGEKVFGIAKEISDWESGD